MKLIRHRRSAADTTGWLLGVIIVVLAVLDLLIWATLWNVPNPISKFLLPEASAQHLRIEPSVFRGMPAGPAHLTAVPAAPAAARELL